MPPVYLVGSRRVVIHCGLIRAGRARRSRLRDARLAVAVVVRLHLLLLFVDVGQPRAGRFALARSNLEEDLLNTRGDVAAPTCADSDPINGAYGRDFGGRARKEKLV